MSHYLRASFLTTLLTAFLMFVPSSALAATAVFPNSVPSPTKAPTKPLPAAPLPDGSMTPPPLPDASIDTTSAGQPSTTSASNGTMLTIGIGVLVLVGLWWFLARRKNEPIQPYQP